MKQIKKQSKRSTIHIILFSIIICISFTFFQCKKNEQSISNAEILFVKTKMGLKLRELPNQDSKVIKVIPYNTDVCIIEKNKDEITIDNKLGKWVKIQYETDEGWAFDAFLSEGKYEENVFLKTNSGDSESGFIVNYNTSFLSKVFEKQLSSDDVRYKPFEVDYNLFKTKPPVELNERVIIVTSDKKVFSDTIKKFYLKQTDYGLVLFFTIDKCPETPVVCFKEKYILNNNISLNFPQEKIIESDSKNEIISGSIEYLVKNNQKDSLQMNPEFSETIDLSKLGQYIISNFTVKVKTYHVLTDTYTFVSFEHLKSDFKFHNATVIMKNSRIIFAKNSTEEIFFLINNKPYVLITIWKPYTDAISQPLAELTENGLEYKYYNDLW